MSSNEPHQVKTGYNMMTAIIRCYGKNPPPETAPRYIAPTLLFCSLLFVKRTNMDTIYIKKYILIERYRTNQFLCETPVQAVEKLEKKINSWTRVSYFSKFSTTFPVFFFQPFQHGFIIFPTFLTGVPHFFQTSPSTNGELPCFPVGSPVNLTLKHIVRSAPHLPQRSSSPSTQSIDY